MAVPIRDNRSLETRDQAELMVRNEVGQPSFTLTIDGKVCQAYQSQTILSAAIDKRCRNLPA